METKWILIFAIICIPFQLAAEDVRSDSKMMSEKEFFVTEKTTDSTKVFDWKPSTSVYFELLGKGFYSLNVDFRKTKFRAWSIGIQVAEDGVLPSLMYYHFGGQRFRFEMGGGFSTVFTSADGLAGIGVHGVIGYRVQKKKGLLFRVGFTPLIGIPLTDTGRFAVVPLVGISLGHSF